MGADPSRGADASHGAAASGRTGAQELIAAFLAHGVDTCFANPGTSEMHFVAALDQVPGMRAVLALFEGVATGAADGYGRMTGGPAAALLHLGPGLSNGLANLHNARRARSPVVAVVGDHARSHSRLDAPLQSDISALAGVVSQWYRSTASPADVAGDAVDAIRASIGRPAGVATLVLPADVSWGTAGGAVGEAVVGGAPTPGSGDPGDHRTTGARRARTPPARVALAPPDAIDAAAVALRSGEPCAILLGGTALRRRPLEVAARLCHATGARFLAETLPGRLERGAGIPAPEGMIYLAELAVAQLAGLRHLVLVDTPPPVSFFAYPQMAGALWPPECVLHTLAAPSEDAEQALIELADRLGVPEDRVPGAPCVRPDPPDGPLDASSLAQAVGALLPADAIVVDESNTAGIYLTAATAAAPPHDWLCLSGGAIGQGLPLAVGAAIGGGGRPVVCLEADGSAMYTLQALWTQAREGLDVTTVILANHSYAILRMELARVGAGEGGPLAGSLLDLGAPELDMVALAHGMGVPATRARTAGELVDQLASALASPGPVLIEAVLPSQL